MQRIAIIGNAGGGKSTLGRQLSLALGIPFYSVDQIQWRPGWMAAPERELTEALDALAARESWIIDGWGPWASIERPLGAADTIIHVDLPLWMHFWLAAERQIAVARGESRSDPIEGCDQLAVTKRLFETIWIVDQTSKPRLAEMLSRYGPGKTLHHITTLEALDGLSEAMTPPRDQAPTRIAS